MFQREPLVRGFTQRAGRRTPWSFRLFKNGRIAALKRQSDPARRCSDNQGGITVKVVPYQGTALFFIHHPQGSGSISASQKCNVPLFRSSLTLEYLISAHQKQRRYDNESQPANKRKHHPEIVDKLLFEGLDYKGETADVIIVLGSRKACDYRVPLAAKLFRKEKPHISYSAEERCKRLPLVTWQNIKPCSYPPKMRHTDLRHNCGNTLS